MITVSVKPFLHISAAMGKRGEFHVDLDDEATIRDLLSLLRQSYDLPDKIHANRITLELFEGDNLQFLNVFKNGINIKTLDGLKTKLEEGASIAIFPLVAGG
jgi:molybdopterin converting factor small subunit